MTTAARLACAVRWDALSRVLALLPDGWTARTVRPSLALLRAPCGAVAWLTLPDCRLSASPTVPGAVALRPETVAAILLAAATHDEEVTR
jgi:hypothetical protein